MKIIKNILGAFWALWGLITFCVTLLIIVIPVLITFLIKEPMGTEAYRQITKIWMSVWLTVVGSPLKVVGRGNFKKGKNYVVVSNHNSLMDVPVTTPYVPGANKTIGKKSFSKAPVFGWVYIRGTVLVDRNSDASRRKSFENMKKVLAQGLHMVIYPEGTRNRTADPLKSFHDGAFKLAIAAEKEIIPTLIFHTKTVLPPEKNFYMRPHRLEMHFLPAVSSENITSRELREKVFKLMWDYYLEKNRSAG
ncbi:lysophospholipid acyltransferase family protein [Segetibacter sp.]|jgi:1-acyl-sn-glycerol-3-phosphate acyltransferase|uniref:lysophospholipid acyltransferase family protein n=1 Tax=Segetibacter sp. TaxID=2231182 RepID=UPI0026073820|nr:lysophospholipid acyltransferase family protein [Segetibacter sp.]MCW3079211.1 1-acyl-sn-glycerol-3-phosphate acyltransferase [Segetibacter sp.]